MYLTLFYQWITSFLISDELKQAHPAMNQLDHKTVALFAIRGIITGYLRA